MPKELLVQTYLRSGHTFSELLAEHGVKATPYNGKISLAYDQLSARNNDPLACQCRGLILRELTLDVVAYPFDRFFNEGQDEAAEIDWSTARFEEKLDGTLLIVYWDDVANRWMCGTRNMCEAQGNINGAGTFAELADVAALEAGVGATDLNSLLEGIALNRRNTYMMELTGPHNTIVCQYRALGLTLLGARSLDTFEELDPTLFEVNMGLPTVATWSFSSLAELTEVIRTWDPRDHEGVVIKDARFNRIKVKSPAYVAAAHASESLGNSWRAVCDAILTGIADDLIGIVPPLVEERINRLRPVVAEVISKTEADYAEICGEDNMKSFAEMAKVRIWPAALFSVKRQKAASVGDFAKESGAESMLAMCEKIRPGVMA